ncbi:PIF-0 [Betabaculovirus altermyunipunctae]|uniref:PIF-0 n=1 Tax=Betabaculovirus altermyunipunctae TaxID=3051996 RepID=A0A1S5YE63_9BBAC|nr:PIF-0 [Betabaculovirus altermyunipunctae]AQQ80335.1 PIF-0 [Betabaculovirus altermyunipunctae]
MALPTAQDMIWCDQFVQHRVRLHLIRDWRARFPHLFIDYTVRYATNNDYYVPPDVLNKQALVVEINFSKEGCEAMTCYPYTATGVIDVNSPIGGYTQTSNTSVQYNQPACFFLDRALAVRNGELQSIETRYSSNGQCVMVDSFTKMYMNTPYMRTEDRRSAGIDDVPGFDTAYSDNPVFPDKVDGFFNAAYCRRFGRDVVNENSPTGSGCAQAWWEMLIGFVLGDSIYASFKLLFNGVVGDMIWHNYNRPSPILPPAPPAGGRTMLDEWMERRDSAFDENFERRYITHDDFGELIPGMELVYRAGQGYSYRSTANSTDKRSLIGDINAARLALLHGRQRRESSLKSKAVFDAHSLNTSEFSYADNDDLDTMIIDFLEDHSFIIGILTDLGFNILESQLEKLLKEVSSQLLPILRNVLLSGSKRFTSRFAAEVYKSVVIHTVHKALIRTVAIVAKMMFRAVKIAMSVINVVLFFLTIVDFVLMIWDPYGYNNMFPRGYLDDLSNAFLGSMYESVGVENRDIIEILPEMFSSHVTNSLPTSAVEHEEINELTVATISTVIYLDSLKINSNGQIIMYEGNPLTGIDLESLVSSSFAANRNYQYFKWFMLRHNTILLKHSPLVEYSTMLGGFLLLVGGAVAVYKGVNRKSLQPPQLVAFSVLFLILIMLGLWLVITESIEYYMRLYNHNTPAPPQRKFPTHKPFKL